MQQIKDKNQECERLEEEEVSPKNKVENLQIELTMNIQQIKGFELLNEILDAQRSPLVKIGLKNEGEYNESKEKDKSTITFVKIIMGDNDTSHYSQNKKLGIASTSNE